MSGSSSNVVSGVVPLVLFMLGIAVFVWTFFTVARRALERHRIWLGVVRAGALVFGLGVINWVACQATLLAMGGSAISGHVSNGRYFLAAGPDLNEVNQSVFHFLYQYEHLSGLFVSVAVVGVVVLFVGFLVFIKLAQRNQQRAWNL